MVMKWLQPKLLEKVYMQQPTDMDDLRKAATLAAKVTGMVPDTTFQAQQIAALVIEKLSNNKTADVHSAYPVQQSSPWQQPHQKNFPSYHIRGQYYRGQQRFHNHGRGKPR